MTWVHESNLLNKIKHNYHGKANELKKFYDKEYLPIKQKLLRLSFSGACSKQIKDATQLFNYYYKSLKQFSAQQHITSQSKLESSFLEEISCFLFKDLPAIRKNQLNFFNKGIFAGLQIDSNQKIQIVTKDVDFCIGKEMNLSIDNEKPQTIVFPILAVEVKTYLDATMFGEVLSSSRAIRNASPATKTYVLMGYRSMHNSHIIAARNDSALTEMFVLQEDANSPISAEVLEDYWNEITRATKQAFNTQDVNSIGRLLKRN